MVLNKGNSLERFLAKALYNGKARSVIASVHISYTYDKDTVRAGWCVLRGLEGHRYYPRSMWSFKKWVAQEMQGS